MKSIKKTFKSKAKKHIKLYWIFYVVAVVGIISIFVPAMFYFFLASLLFLLYMFAQNGKN